MKSMLIILVLLLTGCENGQLVFSEEQRQSIKSMVGKGAKLRREFFIQCMELSAKITRQGDDDVSDIISQCDSTSSYQVNHMMKGEL